MKDVKRDLPRGWRWVKIEEVCEINPRKRAGFFREPSAPTSFVPMEAIDEDTGCIVQRISRPYSEIAKGYTYFEEGDVLFAKITPCMQNGKSAIAKNLIDGIGFGSTEFHVIRPKPDITKEWIYFFVRTKEFRKEAEAHFEGSAGQQRVPTDFIENYLIPFPPSLDDQIAIANKLERKMAEVETMRQASLRQKEAVNALQSARLREFFPFKKGERLPAGWRWEKLRKLSTNIQYGISISSTSIQKGRKLLRITDIQNGKVDWGQVPYCECNGEEETKYLLKDGDIVFVRTGATTGKSFLIRNPDHALFASYLIRVQCNSDLIDPDYLYTFFQSPAYWSYISQGARGGTLAGFNATMLSKMMIPLPPTIDEQVEIANICEQRLFESGVIQHSAEKQLDAIEAMPGAILREVFDFGKN